MTRGELPDRLVWVDDATVVLSGGPVRVVTDEVNPDFVPSPLLGFIGPARGREVEPLLWEGDQA